MTGPLDGYVTLPSGPFLYMEAVTPADDTELPGGLARGFMVFADGDVTWLDAKGNEHVLTGLTAGTVVACAVSAVQEATTATIKAGY